MKIKRIEKLKVLNPIIWLILILIFATLIRLFFFVGLNLNDDLTYVNTAYDIITGKFRVNTWIIAARYVMNLPIAFFFLLLGVSDFSAALWPLLTSLGSVIITYFIGKEIFDVKVGLLAAFLLSVFPVDVAYATTIVPDIPVAFFMGLSVLFFVLGEKKNNFIYYFFSGVSIGLAWMVKSMALVILPFFAIYFLMDKLGFGLKSNKRKVSSKEYKFAKCLGIIAIILLILSSGYAIFSGKVNLSALSIMKSANTFIVENGTELYGKGIAKLYAFRTDKNIYWDVESNLYTNKGSRGTNNIKEDLEYSLHNDKVLHSLRDDIKLLAEVKPYKNINCSKNNFTLSYVQVEKGKMICLKTMEGNYIKLKIVEVNDDSVMMEYEVQ